nr:hypothetical protein [Micromonospora sp. DSM 115978]
FYKLDTDPEVSERLPGGWTDIDYMVFGYLDVTKEASPILAEALEHSVIVKTFGDYEILVHKIVKPGCSPDTPLGVECIPLPSATGPVSSAAEVPGAGVSGSGPR